MFTASRYGTLQTNDALDSENMTMAIHEEVVIPAPNLVKEGTTGGHWRRAASKLQ